MILEGNVWRYGDNIDTDVIIPARYLNSFDPKELASHCMVDIDESFAPNVQDGDIMVGGRNFGCGSSRENTRRLLSRHRASPSSLLPVLPVSFIAMPSTWACPYWKSATLSNASMGKTACASI